MSHADYQRIIDIAENIYGHAPGGAGGDGSQETE
jgi:hypothetical protein